VVVVAMVVMIVVVLTITMMVTIVTVSSSAAAAWYESIAAWAKVAPAVSHAITTSREIAAAGEVSS